MQSRVSTEIAQKLKRQQTPWEVKLWKYLRNRRFFNIKFKRQLRIGDYVYDFGCYAKKILIELDGSGHTDLVIKAKDVVKQDYAKSQGYKIIRFWNNDLEKNIEGVLEEIGKQIKI